MGGRVLLVVLLLVCVSHSCAAADWLADRSWQLDRNSAANATMNSTADGLSIDLKNKFTSPIQIACDAPIAIPAGTKRLTLWADPAAMGSAFSWKVLTASIHAKVRDAKGTVHRFPFCVGSLNNRGWGCQATEDLALCPYRRPGENRPQSPLFVMGLEIKPGPMVLKHIRLHALSADSDARTLPARPWEILSLADPTEPESWRSWTANGVQYDAEDWHGTPHLTMDALVDRPGRYVIGVRMRDGWEGPVQRKWTQEVSLSPTDFDRQKRGSLPVPPPHPGVYFLEARIWERDIALRAVKHSCSSLPRSRRVPPRRKRRAASLRCRPNGAARSRRPNEPLRQAAGAAAARGREKSRPRRADGLSVRAC